MARARVLLNSLHSLAPPTTWLCTVSLADDLARVTRTCRYSSSLLADACRCPEDLADDLGKQFSTRNIDRDCIIFNKFLKRSGMVCGENLSGTIQFFAKIRNFETFFHHLLPVNQPVT